MRLLALLILVIPWEVLVLAALARVARKVLGQISFMPRNSYLMSPVRALLFVVRLSRNKLSGWLRKEELLRTKEVEK